VRADLFDRLNNVDLNKAIKGDGVKLVAELSAGRLAGSGGHVPGMCTLIILQTREGRLAKLVVQAGQQRSVRIGIQWC
jgi:hypothetical protein